MKGKWQDGKINVKWGIIRAKNTIRQKQKIIELTILIREKYIHSRIRSFVYFVWLVIVRRGSSKFF
jgi:hypothetical protein